MLWVELDHRLLYGSRREELADPFTWRTSLFRCEGARGIESVNGEFARWRAVDVVYCEWQSSLEKGAAPNGMCPFPVWMPRACLNLLSCEAW